MHDPIIRGLFALAICLLIITAFVFKKIIDEAYKPKLSDEEIEEMRQEALRSSSL
jgi:hypothetical protein